MAGRVAKRIGQCAAIALVLVLIAGAVVAYMYRVDIQDHFLARSFEPSERIVQVNDELDLTSTGERVFMASKPTIGEREEFAEWCARVDHSEAGHVLGCFADRRIRLFNVTDERLAGIVEVTAAHELLHATYARMTQPERERLSKILEAAYEERSEVDPSFKERMSVYEQLSRAAFANELHSVFGTEVADLPDELEDHYTRWFDDRAQIVTLYDSYHSVFTELTAEAESLSAELEELRADIEARSAAYDEAVRQFNADAANFKVRNENFEFSGNKPLFDQVRGELIYRQQTLEDTLKGIQADTDRFNEMRNRLLDLNAISVELNEVLDSNLPTPTAAPDDADETEH